MKKENLARMFFELGAIQVNTKEKFTLASGKLSPLYFDHRLLMSFIEVRNALVDVWAEEIADVFQQKQFDIKNTVIAGTLSAGIAPALLLAQKLNLQFAYVRTAPKGHGLGKQWEGASLNSGQNVLLLDDMITTGKSVAGAAAGVRDVCLQKNARFLGVTCITKHPFATTTTYVEGLSEFKLFHSCFDSQMLIEIGEKNGFLCSLDTAQCYTWLAENS